jgi:hypothetical protein
VVNTTDEWWDIDGESLNRAGWNISTLGGRFNVPSLRGEDITYAYVPGQEPGTVVPDARTVTFQMWMVGIDRTTGSFNVDQRRAWNDNWKFLTRLFWQPNKLLTITRRLLLTDATTGLPYIQTTTAQGRYAGGLDVEMNGRTRGTFSVDVKLFDGFFWGPEQLVRINAGQTVVVNNPGDYEAGSKNFTITVHGELGSALLTNTTPDPNMWVKYDAIVSAGNTVTLDVENFTALASAPEIGIPEAGLSRTGYVVSSGMRHRWMSLARGNNSVGLGGSYSGTPGYAELRFQPAYL